MDALTLSNSQIVSERVLDGSIIVTKRADPGVRKTGSQSFDNFLKQLLYIVQNTIINYSKANKLPFQYKFL